MEQLLTEMLRRLLPLPTAPFCEHFVASAARSLGQDLPGVACQVDAHGNLLLLYEGRGTGRRLTVTAHMDHPGLLFADRLSSRDCLFEKAGGVPVEEARDAPVRVYLPEAGPEQEGLPGRIAAYCGVDSAPVLARGLAAPAYRVRLEAEGGIDIGPGAFAMLDLPAIEVDGRHVRGRACDDVAGCAVGLAWLAQVARAGGPARCGLLLTRAEEVGFIGMLAATREGRLDREAVYVNLECSSEVAGAPLGQGPVVRTGDRAWVFDPAVAAALVKAAEDGQAPTEERHPPRYQRRLMDRGTCEATVLARAGFTAGALALPLRNYHNRGRNRPEPEVIDLDDAVGLVRLLQNLAAADCGVGAAVEAATAALDRRLRELLEAGADRLLRTARPPDPPPGR